MHRSVSKQLVPAKNWEGMRWIVCVAPDEMNSCNEVLESYVLNYPNSCFQELIVDREVKPYLAGKGLSVGHAEAAWWIASSLAESRLCSRDLADYCDIRTCSLNIEIFDAVQMVFTLVAKELSNGIELPLRSPQDPSNAMEQAVHSRLQTTYLNPSADLARFFHLVLDHIHWFSIGRFRNPGEIVEGAPYSIWLNYDEYEAGPQGSTEKTYKLSESLLN